jgi:two-component system sensor kinase FixL
MCKSVKVLFLPYFRMLIFMRVKTPTVPLPKANSPHILVFPTRDGDPWSFITPPSLGYAVLSTSQKKLYFGLTDRLILLDLYGIDSLRFLYGIRGMSAVEDTAKQEPWAEEHRLLAAIVHDSNDAITVQDFDGNIKLWNLGAERIYGYTKAEALKMNVGQIAPNHKRGEFLALMKSLKEEEEIRSFETQRLTKDGRLINIWITITILTDEAGNPVGIATTERDITERKRLERELLAIKEKEQKLIGQEMHDSIGQILTGIAVKSKGLEIKLNNKSWDESADAAEICKLASEAIAQTRRLAKMLYPIDIEAGGLVSALQGLASQAKDLLKVSCQFKYKNMVPIGDPLKARHLYRIAQEAITNAARHAKAKNVKIELVSDEDTSTLKIENDGKDFSKRLTRKTGLGLRIMEYRANMIGGSLDIGRGRKGGTIVTCTFPNVD